MMGKKIRSFAPLPLDVSLEELVPKDHFYRRLEARLDLSFVRELVAPLYANGGRPSVDPVVFFKLQLVMFFEDLRSERQLMAVVADRLSLRWYLGYDLDEPLPDHSSLTRIRERFGLEVFRRFFERIVQECMEAGLVWGEELFFDATKVEANASPWRAECPGLPPRPTSASSSGARRPPRLEWEATWLCLPRGPISASCPRSRIAGFGRRTPKRATGSRKTASRTARSCATATGGGATTRSASPIRMPP
jgi:transposase